MFFSKKPPLPNALLFQEQTIVLRPFNRSKSLRLTYDSKANHFRITHPLNAKLKDIQSFLERAQPWIEKKLKTKHTEVIPYHEGAIPIFGVPHKIHFQKDLKKKVLFDAGMVIVSHPKEDFLPLLEQAIQTKILTFLTETSTVYANHLKKTVHKVSVRDTRSRWGSCSSSGSLSYSWRLIFAPREVTEYVCAHEVSHLVHMNHSEAFWKTVESLCPAYKKHRAWLNKNGRQLFLYKF